MSNVDQIMSFNTNKTEENILSENNNESLNSNLDEDKSINFYETKFLDEYIIHQIINLLHNKAEESIKTNVKQNNIHFQTKNQLIYNKASKMIDKYHDIKKSVNSLEFTIRQNIYYINSDTDEQSIKLKEKSKKYNECLILRNNITKQLHKCNNIINYLRNITGYSNDELPNIIKSHKSGKPSTKIKSQNANFNSLSGDINTDNKIIGIIHKSRRHKCCIGNNPGELEYFLNSVLNSVFLWTPKNNNKQVTQFDSSTKVKHNICKEQYIFQCPCYMYHENESKRTTNRCKEMILLTDELYKLFNPLQKLTFENIQFRERIKKYGDDCVCYCKNPKCFNSKYCFIVTDLVYAKNNPTYNYPHIITKRICPKCEYSWCTDCNIEPFHESSICPGPINELINSMSEIDKEEFLKTHKACPSCKNYIELIDGCDNIICTCKVHFCWRCRGIRNPKDPHSHICPKNVVYTKLPNIYDFNM